MLRSLTLPGQSSGEGRGGEEKRNLIQRPGFSSASSEHRYCSTVLSPSLPTTVYCIRTSTTIRRCDGRIVLPVQIQLVLEPGGVLFEITIIESTRVQPVPLFLFTLGRDSPTLLDDKKSLNRPRAQQYRSTYRGVATLRERAE